MRASELASYLPRPTHARVRVRSFVRSRRLRSQGRIPKSDGDVKEAHRRTYQDNESLRSTPVDVVRAGDAVAQDSERNDIYTNEPNETSQTNETIEEPSARPPSSSSSQQSPNPNTQRASILIDILSTAPLNIEAKIADYADSIDPELLHLLEGRIAAARQLEQDQATVDGLIALYYRLKSEYDRRTASPALRLLDTLLSMMLAEDDDDREGADGVDVDSDSDDGEYTEGDGKRRRRRRIPTSREDRVALVRARMQLAFDESLSLDTDVFTVAQQLAVGKRRFVDELINEQVDGGEFVKEVEGLLKRAVEQQVAGNALLADGEQGTGARAPGERERLRQALEQRERTIECVEELLVLARSVWYRQRN